ncbi:hypothetical protein RJ639_009721 [Escallonia herrerae]|uniref:Plastid movement impaired 2 n=1 Tax=Escallonia herrerae TaxID=1293975 RepID=A0AA89ARP5_9ASTE|nr:hypothetical protein RJ639_009721 [Escallonia herrerae]
MGNNMGGGRKKAKVMKINGETLKFKTPVKARDVVSDYPGHVLLESKSVKQFGIRAKPLANGEDLMPRKIYFLVELPKRPPDDAEKKVTTRRVQSGVHMSATDRLECLMLSRRSASDLSLMRPPMSSPLPGGAGLSSGSVRVKMRLPGNQVARLVEESQDGAEVGEKIVELYMQNKCESDKPVATGDDAVVHRRQLVQWNPGRQLQGP